MYKANRKKIDLFEVIESSKQLENIVNRNKNVLICAEIFCSFSGWCTSLEHLFNIIKLDWSDSKILLLRICADKIDKLKRFQEHSEPFYMFIVDRKVTQSFRGVDMVRFGIVAKNEIQYHKMWLTGESVERPLYDIGEPMPEERIWLDTIESAEKQETDVTNIRRAMRQAERKKHRAELMAPHLQHLNFVLYWPHAKHAHPELYERWDMNNIIMVGREEIQLSEETAHDLLYAGDAPLNEAAIHALLAAPALIICFRLLDEDKHFVSLVRRILYEDIPSVDDAKAIVEQIPRVTAYDLYKSYSLSKDKILEQRRLDKIRIQEEKAYKRARRLSEMQRLAREAIQDAIQAKHMHREQQKLELLKTGNLNALDALNSEPVDDIVSIVVPEELDGEIEQEESEEENADEYFPPAGLLVPGFYSPPNDVAKANGLAIAFPKIVEECVKPQAEFLPPHVLVKLNITKRHKAVANVARYKKSIIHMGVFKASHLSFDETEHIAFSVKQFDSMDQSQDEITKLMFMMSTTSDLGLLELVDLGPDYVSRNVERGEEDCSAVFPVNYGETYDEFEDFVKDDE